MATTAYLYVLDTMADWEAAFISAELTSGRFFRPGAPRLTLKTCARRREPIRTLGGLRLLPDCTLDEVRLDEACLLILPGAETWLSPEQGEVMALAAQCRERDVSLAAICGATAALAAAGLLDDDPHTSNSLAFLEACAPGYRGGAHYRQCPALRSGTLITAGGTAPLEFAAEILRALDVFSAPTLAAWLALYQSHDPALFDTLLATLNV